MQIRSDAGVLHLLGTVVTFLDVVDGYILWAEFYLYELFK